MVTNGVAGANAITTGDLTPTAIGNALKAQGYSLTGSFGESPCHIIKDGSTDFLAVKVTVDESKKFTLDLKYAEALNSDTIK